MNHLVFKLHLCKYCDFTFCLCYVVRYDRVEFILHKGFPIEQAKIWQACDNGGLIWTTQTLWLEGELWGKKLFRVLRETSQVWHGSLKKCSSNLQQTWQALCSCLFYPSFLFVFLLYWNWIWNNFIYNILRSLFDLSIESNDFQWFFGQQLFYHVRPLKENVMQLIVVRWAKVQYLQWLQPNLSDDVPPCTQHLFFFAFNSGFEIVCGRSSAFGQDFLSFYIWVFWFCRAS